MDGDVSFLLEVWEIIFSALELGHFVKVRGLGLLLLL